MGQSEGICLATEGDGAQARKKSPLSKTQVLKHNNTSIVCYGGIDLPMGRMNVLAILS